MRQKDYTIARQRLRKRKKRLLGALVTDADAALLFRLNKAKEQAKKYMRRILRRSRSISKIFFNINSFSDERAPSEFRFRTKEIGTVSRNFSWSGGLTKRNSYFCDSITAKCIVLNRLSFPTRWKDLETTLGMQDSKMCEVFYGVVETFLSERGHLHEGFRSDLMIERAEMYASAIYEKGAPLDNCVGFRDCTKTQMSRPGGSGSLQRTCYSGHKRFHCLIHQTVTTPDGLMFHLYGPEVVRRHDMTFYRQSGIDEQLQSHMLIDGKQYCLYGDPAYVLRAWFQIAFNRAFATPDQLMYNKDMSMVREAVEWTYKDLKQIWTSQDFKRMLLVRKSPIAILDKAAALLWNVRVACIRAGDRQAAMSYANLPHLRDT